MQKYILNDLVEFKNSFNPKVLMNEPSHRLMLISMRQGHTVPEHSAPGKVTIHALQGHVTFFERETACDLQAGEIVSMEPGARHRVEAHEDSVLLVTITGMGLIADVAANSVEELDLRNVPRPLRHPLIFAKFDALPIGSSMRLLNDHDPIPLSRQLETIRPEQALWEYEERGPNLFRIRITRIAPPSAADTPLSAPAQQVQLRP
jgi:uncharacterized protein (DUF2249 family)